ncbi:MAG: L,D-transpeptidase family protein [Mycobacteriaceae bacterium]|nr:L,D-transpeptidase family protein [Mycobacteriaceae bacterium]
MRRRRFIQAASTVAVAAALDTACGTTDKPGSGDKPHRDKASGVAVQYRPEPDSKDVNPAVPVSVAVDGGVLRGVALTNAAGKPVAGQLSPDNKTFSVTEPLGYGGTYTWSGTAVGKDNKQVAVRGGFSTLKPKKLIAVNVQIADGQTVGIAAPVILQFNAPVTDKAAVERALAVKSTPATEGSWAWLPDDRGSRAHWRPKDYWRPGTAVHVEAKLYGLSYGDGAYGLSDITSDFTVGRSQIVKGVVPTHRIQVFRDGQVLFDFPCSYGAGDQKRNTTRSGIHIVSEKYEDFMMSNPPFYTNVRERFAVRISNNGEFIHANPLSVGSQGSANVSNGCVNLSTDHAQQYFQSALYGDPVEISGTSVPLSAADGDVYDWTIDWPTWKSMSALYKDTKPVSSDEPLTPGR